MTIRSYFLGREEPACVQAAEGRVISACECFTATPKFRNDFFNKNKLRSRRANEYKETVSRTRFAILILALGTLAIYLPASHYGFTLYDDTVYVSENPIVQQGLTWAGIKWAFTTWHASNWHPVTWLSHMLDCQLFGLNAGMHHVVNILFHTANSILLFILLRRWTNAVWPSAFVAALFAWHPLHVESVAWIAERKDVLSTFFALLTLMSYTRFVEHSKVQNPKSKIFYLLTLLLFALALMSKPMFVTLPFVMLLLDWWPLKRVEGFKLKVTGSKTKNLQPATCNLQLLIEKIPFFFLVAGCCVLTFLAQHRGGAVVSLKVIPLGFRFENAPVAVARYLSKMFWPEHLAVFYPLIDIHAVTLVIALAVLILISAAAWLTRKAQPYFLVGWLWFLGTLVPVIGLVQVGSAALADRYTYFPSIGIFLAVALGIAEIARQFHFKKIIIAVPAILVLGACLFLTHRQLNYWRNDIALFSHAIAVTKENPTAHVNLGYALQKNGQNKKAMQQYREALKIEPDNTHALNNFANLLDDTGHSAEALTNYESAIRFDPNFVAARNNYGTLLVELGRFDDAMKQYSESEKLDPTDWHAPFLIGKLRLKQGRDAEAIPFFQKALRLDPDNLNILTFVAQVLASDENPKVRDGRAAYLLAEKADELTHGIQPAMLDALAMAYAELGRFRDAQNAASDALKVAKAVDDTNDVPDMEQRLELYKNNQPFRQSFTNVKKAAKE